ncbi:hypothetical protein [Massilimicrobiota sp. SW1139]|uniref:hypothetical protein n=1 Tax=Bacillota TaxID=1239 RepID=UPI001438AB95|nr:hypothetical protein [Massilimicrobiota sp. SW1139]
MSRVIMNILIKDSIIIVFGNRYNQFNIEESVPYLKEKYHLLELYKDKMELCVQ